MSDVMEEYKPEGNTLYCRKEKQVSFMKLSHDGTEFCHTNTLGMGIAWDNDNENTRVFENCKIGHIEVSVREVGGTHFAERLEKFLLMAAGLYDEIVLGNSKLEHKIVKID